MELKDVLGEIEADGANLVHGRLLEWALTPPLWHADAVGGVHTIRPRPIALSCFGMNTLSSKPILTHSGPDAPMVCLSRLLRCTAASQGDTEANLAEGRCLTT